MLRYMLVHDSTYVHCYYRTKSCKMGGIFVERKLKYVASHYKTEEANNEKQIDYKINLSSSGCVRLVSYTEVHTEKINGPPLLKTNT